MLKPQKKWLKQKAARRMSKPTYFEQALTYIDNWFINQKRHDHETPGYSVVIMHDGDVIFKKAYGLANIANREDMTPAHLFRVASHSKTFTATAIMQLMEAGKLNIYEPACKYLPFLKDAKDKRLQKITIQQMLAHSSGISRDGDNPSFWLLEKSFPTKAEVLSFFAKEETIIDNNTRFKYSNYAYGLLGWIIEEISGLSYIDYMQQHIFDPLALEDIGGEFDPDKSPYITGYTGIAPNGKQTPLPANLMTGDIVGATGFCSTAESLCKFYTAVMPGSGQLLGDELKKEMLRQQWEIPDEEMKRGYGLGFTYQQIGKHILNGHSGGMPGNITQTFFDSQEKIAVSILTNSHSGVPAMLQKGVWHILNFFKDHYSENQPFAKYAGQFYSIWGTSYFVPTKDKIFVSDPTLFEPFAGASELEHLERDKFKITKESGYGFYGQYAEFLMNGETVNEVRYGNFPMYTENVYIEKLKQIAT